MERNVAMRLSELERVLPYPLLYARAAALDLLETVSRDATVRKDRWQLTGTVNLYGNESRVAVEIVSKDERRSVLCIKMLEPSPRLSADGQGRTLSFLADGMEQLLENTLSQGMKKERA